MTIPFGWTCPICHQVYAAWVPFCTNRQCVPPDKPTVHVVHLPPGMRVNVRLGQQTISAINEFLRNVREENQDEQHPLKE